MLPVVCIVVNEAREYAQPTQETTEGERHMSNANAGTESTVAIAPSGATKYRAATRKRLVEEGGYDFDQISTSVDQFTKDGVTAQFFHGSKDTMVAAEIHDGDAPNEVIREGKQKLERAIAKLLGEVHVEGSRWILSKSDEKELPPLGVGYSLIKVIDLTPVVEAEAEEEVVVEVTDEKVTEEPAPVKKPVRRTRTRKTA